MVELVAPEAVVVSFRLGGADGVAVEARKGAWALGELGFQGRRGGGGGGGEGRAGGPAARGGARTTAGPVTSSFRVSGSTRPPATRRITRSTMSRSSARSPA